MSAFSRTLWALLCAGLLLPATVPAATYSARLRWQASGTPDVVGYRVYVRPSAGAYGAGQNAGNPTPGTDGSIAYVLSTLDPRTDYLFAVSAYRSDGSETPRSNERALGYAQVAALVDSDGDGLTDAEEDVDLDRVVDAGETDPQRADTDGDGVPDGNDDCGGTVAGAAVSPAGCSCAQVTCDDGNVCNGTETCQAGVCRPGTPLNCADGNACTSDTCSPSAGCQHAPIASCSACTANAQCDDGNACNGAETCQAGVCRAGTTPNCDDRDACTIDTCTAQAGCTHTAIVGCRVCTATGQCDDGNPCNGTETCQNGVCRAGTTPNCNDNNPCTTDSCSPGSGCTHVTIAGCTACTSAAQCNDGNVCNGTETCSAGVCRPGTPPNCNDRDACTADTCVPGTGCTHTPMPSCERCTSTSQCNDGNGCTTDACTNGACTHTQKSDGASCTDGLFCTTGDHCEEGVCVAGGPNCQNGTNECRTGSCDENANRCVTTPLPDGTRCGDKNACVADEVCRGGVCQSGPALDCNDHDICTADSCDPERNECVHVATESCCTSNADCFDDDVCTSRERCDGGRCVSERLECTAPGPCSEATCDPVKGCTTTPLADGTACDDGDPCTNETVCTAGTCGSASAAGVARTAPARATGPELGVRRFTLRPIKAGRAYSLSAEGKFARETLPDVATDGATLEILGEDGSAFYSVQVAGSAFEVKGYGYIYMDRSESLNGLRRLELKVKKTIVYVYVKATLDAASVGEMPMRSAGTAEAKSVSRIAWVLRFGERCVRDKDLTCQTNRYRQKQCR